MVASCCLISPSSSEACLLSIWEPLWSLASKTETAAAPEEEPAADTDHRDPSREDNLYCSHRAAVDDKPGESCTCSDQSYCLRTSQRPGQTGC